MAHQAEVISYIMRTILLILDLQTYIFHLCVHCVEPVSIVPSPECVLEDMISHVLREQFEYVFVDKVNVQFASPLDCYVQAFATCVDLHSEWPWGEEVVEARLEDRISCVLNEFFNTILVDYIGLNIYN